MTDGGKTYADAAAETADGAGSHRRKKNGGGESNKFTGDCADLKGCIFDTNSTNPKETFHKSVRQLAGYVGSNYTRAGEFRIGLQAMKLNPVVVPEISESDRKDPILVELWKIELQDYRDSLKYRKENLEKVFSLILGQCTTAMKDRLEGSDQWSKVNESNDVIELLKSIQEYSTTKTSDQDSSHKLMDAEISFLTFRQKKLSNADYLVAFKDRVEVLERVKGEKLGIDKSRLEEYMKKKGMDIPTSIDVESDLSDDSNKTVSRVQPKETKTQLSNRKKAERACREQYLATNLLLRSDPKRYGELIRATQNDYTRNRTPYPTTLAAAFRLLDNYISEKKERKESPNDAELSFVQDETRGRGGRRTSRNRNAGRGGRGGTSSTPAAQESAPANAEAVPDPANTGSEPIVNADIVDKDEEVYSVDLRSAEAAFLQKSESLGIDRITSLLMWLIMDSGSTIDLVSNLSLLTDVRLADEPVTVRCNAGVTTLTHQGTLGGYPNRVWYHPQGIANILGLRNIKAHYRVTFDSAIDDAFFVHHKDGSTSRFAASEKGLYVLDSPNKQSTDASYISEWSLLATVKEKRALYGVQASGRADLARRVQDIMMRPSTQDYIKYIEHNAIRNCPVERRDIQVAEDIHGPNLGSLKGKTARRNPPHIRSTKDPVPEYIRSKHSDVTLEIDIMYVNKVPFLATISRGLKFGTVTKLDNRRVDTVKDVLKQTCRLYKNRGFRITSILADNEFTPLKEYYPQMECSGRNDHIPGIERQIRTIKERARAAYNLLPFQYIPKLIITRLVENAVFWLNAVPPLGGASPTMSPRHIMTGRAIDYKKHIQIPFGQYVQTHEEHDNDMNARAIGAICLGPVGNSIGTHYFLNVTTGKRIERTCWTELPIPDYVIRRVSAFGRRQGMPRTITFADRYGKEIHDEPDSVDDDHDSLFHPDADYESDVSLHYDSESDSDDDEDDSDDDSDDETVLPSRRRQSVLQVALPAGVSETSTRSSTLTNNRSGGERPRSGRKHPRSGRHSSNGRNTQNAIVGENVKNATRINDTRGQSNESNQRQPRNQPTESNESYAQNGDEEEQTDENSEDDQRTTPHTTKSTDNDSGNDGIDGDDDSRSNQSEIEVETVGVDSDDIDDEQTTGVGDSNDDDDDDDEEYIPVEERPGFFPFASDEIPESITRNYGRGKRGDSDYAAAYNFFSMGGAETYYAYSFLTEQMTAKKGLKVFGQKGADAIIAEMQQIHYRRVLRPRLKRELSREELRAALHYLMFLKEKRCGRIKARGCADGRKQRLWKTKEETSAPTVRTESVFLTAAIDAKEGRKVVTCDIPGAFMQADMDETVHVKFAGEVAELLCKVDPKFYRPYVVNEGGKQVIYCELRKALYGTLQAALLFWKELSGFLVKEMGFKLNPYDDCVANKVINGKQMTILWHVDDLKISHMEQGVIEKILDKLNERFGKEAPITVTRGKTHDYLGMTIVYGDDNSVTFRMDDFVEGILEEAPDDMQGVAITPAANYLFTVNDEARKLDEETADLFHHLVAKLLYLCKRSRPDIHTAVAFLTTRVTQPDVDDYNKLSRCIKYLRDTPDLALRLEVNKTGVIEWYVDASFAVHPDMKGHTGAVMTMGKGAVYTMSTRQKVNTKSSTICELVGVDDAMPNVIWIRRFLEGQSYNVTDNVIYQDNQSAMLLERNGRRSCGKNTRHIDIRYFFITDRIAHGDCRVEYCPTDEMDADPMTKPLQGIKFRKFRQRMLNIKNDYVFRNPRQASGIHNNDLLMVPNRNDTPQECVETGLSQRGIKVPTSDSMKNGAMSVPIEDEWIQISRGRGKHTIPTE